MTISNLSMIENVTIAAAFIAGMATFLAPCTLPLVPGYLAFISGASSSDLNNKQKSFNLRWKVLLNGFFFVLGFSIVFITMGLIAGLAGAFFASYQIWLIRIGGLFVLVFGLFMSGVLHIQFLNRERKFHVPSYLMRGKPTTSLALGTAFGVGWTPCVGPILGAVLTAAATTGQTFQAAYLLSIFSLGLAVPFLLIALGIGSATSIINKYLHVVDIFRSLIIFFLGLLVGYMVNVLLTGSRLFSESVFGIYFLETKPFIIPIFIAVLLIFLGKYVKSDPISFCGGLILAILGILLLSGNFALLLSYTYQILNHFGIEALDNFISSYL